MESGQDNLRKRFLSWQCLLRQRAMRSGGGRPTPGMRPCLSLSEAGTFSEDVTVLINHSEPAADAAYFRHMVLKTHDPVERYGDALKYLAASYYQRPHEFADEMTGLFAAGGRLARVLPARKACKLDFKQFNTYFHLPCSIRQLGQDSDGWQVTYWHNRLFNPNMPAEVVVLGFTPDWSQVEHHTG